MTHVLRLNEESWRLLVTITTETGSHWMARVSIATPEDILRPHPRNGSDPAGSEAHQARRWQAFVLGTPVVVADAGFTTVARGTRVTATYGD